MRKMIVPLALLATLIATDAAMAGYVTCGNQRVPDGTRRCADGSPPVFHATPVQPSPPPKTPAVEQAAPVRPTPQSPSAVQAVPQRPAPPAQQQTSADASSLLGVWHTAVPGGVWQTPSAVPGYDVLHVAPGVRSGDLTIDRSGRYAWNSYGGKVGRWERGDAEYPVVLIDTVENKRWRVGPDRRNPGRIFIWDGSVHYTGKR